MPVGNRIIVLGCPGGGKSTLARKLHQITGLPLIHLDNIWWRADRTHLSREEFDRELEKLLSGDRWIIDGNYSRTCEVRIRACDTVVFLDYDEETCLSGIAARVGMDRSDMPWTESRLDPALVALVKGYAVNERPAVYALLAKYPDRQSVILKSRDDADRWLNECL